MEAAQQRARRYGHSIRRLPTVGQLPLDALRGRAQRDAAKPPLQPKGLPIGASDGAFPHGPDRGVIQRALSKNIQDGSTKAQLEAQGGMEAEVFKHGEALSFKKDWGTDSDTSKFGGADAAISGPLDLKWGTTKVGTLLPAGKITAGKFAGHTQLHLVNSFLHTQANATAANWVFGSSQLNSRHKLVEEKAKGLHPEKSGAVAALSYRTEVKARDTTTRNEGDLAKEIHRGIEATLSKTANPPATELETKQEATVNDKKLAVYLGEWNTAVKNAVATGLEVLYRTYGLNDQDKVTRGSLKKEPVTAEADSNFRAVIDAELGVLLEAGAAKPTKKRTRGAEASGSKKKAKSGQAE